MNGLQLNQDQNVRVLRIEAPDFADKRPTVVEIKLVRSEWLRIYDLSALLSRPRCGQKAGRAVASAPRHYEVIDEQPLKTKKGLI